MKKVISMSVLIAILLCILSSCSFQIRTIDELISPPKAPELKAGIRIALEEEIGQVYTLKSPARGENRSAFLLNDFDEDGTEEAVVFYQLNATQSTVHMAFLKYTEKQWHIVQSIEGQGDDIYSVDFADLDNSGTVEVIVGWELYNNKLKYGLSVYTYDGQRSKKPWIATTQPLSFSAIALADMNGDAKTELLLFLIDSTKTPAEATAKLYSYNKNKLTLMSSTALDNNVTSYSNIFVQPRSATRDIMVYIDGNKGESSMVTEVVVWDEESQMLKAPLSPHMKVDTISTLKGVRVHTRDIDNDNIAEIAVQEAMRSEVDSKYVSLVNWSRLDINYQLQPSGFSLINFYDGYMINIDAATASKISVSYNEMQRSLTISEWDFSGNTTLGPLCEIVAMPRNQWAEAPLPNFSELLKNGDVVYVIKMLSSQEDALTSFNSIFSNIEIYN